MSGWVAIQVENEFLVGIKRPLVDLMTSYSFDQSPFFSGSLVLASAQNTAPNSSTVSCRRERILILSVS